MKFDNMDETFAMKFTKYMKYIFWMKYHHVNKTNFLDETFNANEYCYVWMICKNNNNYILNINNP